MRLLVIFRVFSIFLSQKPIVKNGPTHNEKLNTHTHGYRSIDLFQLHRSISPQERTELNKQLKRAVLNRNITELIVFFSCDTHGKNFRCGRLKLIIKRPQRKKLLVTVKILRLGVSKTKNYDLQFYLTRAGYFFNSACDTNSRCGL